MHWTRHKSTHRHADKLAIVIIRVDLSRQVRQNGTNSQQCTIIRDEQGDHNFLETFVLTTTRNKVVKLVGGRLNDCGLNRVDECPNKKQDNLPYENQPTHDEEITRHEFFKPQTLGEDTVDAVSRCEEVAHDDGEPNHS